MILHHDPSLWVSSLGLISTPYSGSVVCSLPLLLGHNNKSRTKNRTSIQNLDCRHEVMLQQSIHHTIFNNFIASI